MKIILLLISIIVCHISICQAEQVIYLYNQTLDSASGYEWRTVLSTQPNVSRSITLIPCFGKYESFLGLGYPPNRTVYYLANEYDEQEGNARQSFVYPPQQFNTDMYIYVDAITKEQDYEGDVAAVFDVIISEIEPWVTGVIPTPADNGDIEGKFKNDNKDGEIKWQGTGNSSDTYTLYYREGHGTDGGNFPFTACSVRRWMTLADSDIAEIQENDDGSWTAEIKDIPRKEPYSLTVIVSRKDAYESAYDTFIFNGASVVHYTFGMLLVVILMVVV